MITLSGFHCDKKKIPSEKIWNQLLGKSVHDMLELKLFMEERKKQTTKVVASSEKKVSETLLTVIHAEWVFRNCRNVKIGVICEHGKARYGKVCMVVGLKAFTLLNLTSFNAGLRDQMADGIVHKWRHPSLLSRVLVLWSNWLCKWTILARLFQNDNASYYQLK